MQKFLVKKVLEHLSIKTRIETWAQYGKVEKGDVVLEHLSIKTRIETPTPQRFYPVASAF